MSETFTDRKRETELSELGVNVGKKKEMLGTRFWK